MAIYYWYDIFYQCTYPFYWSIIFRVITFILLLGFIIFRLRKVLVLKNYFVFGLLAFYILFQMHARIHMFSSKDGCDTPNGGGRQVLVHDGKVDLDQFAHLYFNLSVNKLIAFCLLAFCYFMVLQIILFFDHQCYKQIQEICKSSDQSGFT